MKAKKMRKTLAAMDAYRRSMAADAKVMLALVPIVKPYSGPLWQRFELSFWTRSIEDTIYFDGWNLRQPESRGD